MKNKKILFFLILFFLGLMSASVTHAETYQFVTKWGSYGTGDGQFADPHGVAVDSPGNVYVADLGNHRIQKFDSNGAFLTKLGSSAGSGDGQFFKPFGVAVDSLGNIYVADTHNNRTQKFDSSGTYLTQWGSYGSGDGQLYYPLDVAVDSSGNVYVADAYNHRIQKFDSIGNFITKWGSRGSGNGQFNRPWSVAVDSSGNIYVADTLNNRTQKFDSNGNYLTQWGSYGSDVGQFSSPADVAVDSSGNVYVVDMGNNRTQKFDSSGTYLTQWGSYGSGDGQFYSPRGIAVDSSGNVYVAESRNNRIQKFAVETIKKTPAINWNPPADITAGTALGPEQLNAVAKDPVTGATVEGIFTYTLSDSTSIVSGVTVLPAGTYILDVDFAPEDTATYTAASAEVQINVMSIPAPTINSIVVPLDPIKVGTSITSSAIVTYQGNFNTLTAEWNWGDGSTSTTQVSSNFENSHTYSSAGIYTVNLRVNDSNGEIATKEASNYAVVYDPQGGFVTGGGWINSPAEAYVSDKTLTGKATFGFVSKYKTGATVPSGNTEFQFKVANLNFRSESYDWLVVAGPQAKFKGTGTINGQGNYGFMLSAFDGAPDKFRIKIWDKDTLNEDVIYDNEIKAAEDAEPTTAIGGGSIIIHTGK